METRSFFEAQYNRAADKVSAGLAFFFSRLGKGSRLLKGLKAAAHHRVWFGTSLAAMVFSFVGYLFLHYIPVGLPSILTYGFEGLMAVGFLFIVLRDRSWGIPVFVVLLPFLTYRPLFLFMLILGAVLFVEAPSRERWRKVWKNRMHLGVFVFFTVLGLTAVASPIRRDSLTDFVLYFLMGLILYVLIVLYHSEDFQIRRTVAALVAGTVLVALYGIYQYMAVDYTSLKWVDLEANPLLRKRSFATFGNPNLFAQYLAYMIPISFALFWHGPTWRLRAVHLLSFGVLLLALVLTFSRGNWLAVFLGGFLLAFMIHRRLFMLGIIGGAAVVMAPLVGFDFIPDIITNRVTSIFEGDTSSDYRFQAWQSAAALIKDYWISGIGMDSQTFLRVYPDYMMSDVRVFHFHNVFLQFFAEGGILLLSSFLFLFYWTARTLVSVMFRSKSRGRGWDSLLAKALFASLFAIALSGMTEDIFRHYRLDLTFFIILGIAAAVTARTESEGTGHEG